MRIHFVIPTTGGLIRILRLKHRPALQASIAVAEGGFMPLPFSAAYSRLVSKEGPLAAFVAPEGDGGYELRIDREIEVGRSWEAPVALLHALLGKGHTVAENLESADLVMWTTGALDLDLKLSQMNYALDEKLRRSVELFRAGAEAGVAIAVALPHADAETLENFRTQLRGADDRAVSIGSLAEAMALAALPPRALTVNAPQQRLPLREEILREPAAATPRPRRKLALASVAALAVLAAGVAAFEARPARWLSHRVAQPSPEAAAPSPTATPVRTVVATAPEAAAPVATPPQPVVETTPAVVQPPASAPIALTELRAPEGQDCSSLIYNDDEAPVRRSVPLTAERAFAASDDEDLCGLQIDADASGGFEFAVDPALLTAKRHPGTPGSREATFKTLTVWFDAKRRPRLDHAIKVFGAGGESLGAYSHSIGPAG